MQIEDITPGVSYACRFRVTTMLDTLGQPAPNLSDTALQGPGEYEGLGVIKIRDLDSRQVKLNDTVTGKDFVVDFDNIWDIDTVDWQDPELSD